MALRRKIRLNEFKKYVDINVENGSGEVETLAQSVKPATPTALLTSAHFDAQNGENGEDSRVEFRIKTSDNKPINNKEREKLEREEGELHEDDILAIKYEEFGTTPPRTRLNKKARDWDRKDKVKTIQGTAASCDVTPIPPKRNEKRRTCGRVIRRNTMDCALLNEMFVNEETKRTAKRSQALLRDEERTFKNIQNSVTGTFSSFSQPRLISYNENVSSMSVEKSQLSALEESNEVALRSVPKVIESTNPYKSVSSRPIGYRCSAPPLSFMSQKRIDAKGAPGLKRREEFHDTFANLIKLGSVDRQEGKISHEEQTWQTEVKDVIWLELQAWQADRTMEQQDSYLYAARQAVPDLLTQIISYKFQPRSCLILNDADSGMSSDSNTSSPQPLSSCSGCMSLYCKYCQWQQKIALKEVEELLTRLEAAEVLYPSSQVMGSFHPIYKSQSFVGRIKAMCMWYNITRQNELKLSIFGKILARLQGSRFSWPVQTSITGTSDSSASTSYDDSAINSMDSTQTPPQPYQRKKSSIIGTKVHFQINDIAQVPEESSSSNESPTSEIPAAPMCPLCPPSLRKNSIHDINIFSVEPLNNANGDAHSTLLYRKFIENVLKSRGLPKAMSFLNKLHNVVLFKAHISLEKPGTLDYDYETDMIEEDVPCIDPEISREQIDELRRYGYWSEEARSINLPSYIPTFVFLSGIPLQFMHEFLRMRLETRPMKPNPLSLEQLMKELREGLTLALTHRERYQRHITTALCDQESEWERYKSVLDQYDKTVKKVFELYLDYIDQMVVVAQAENHWKQVLDKEWMFTKLVSPMINGMHTIAANKFCNIISNMLRSISSRLVNRAAELDEQIYNTKQSSESDIKWQVLTTCRETQTLFTLQRVRAVKVMLFAKNFCRDVESRDFHREHYEESDTVQDFICAGVVEAFKQIQQDVLDLREKLTTIIRNVQDRCFRANISDMDDQDRLAVLSRTREILHQGYKFGFEYHKDVIRLFEQPVMAYKESNNVHLALGIIEFAKMWMQFVRERCERGRGMRPRWASQGLEFLILACDPQITQHLDDTQFTELKKEMDSCISHVIGITSQPEKIAYKKASPRRRKTSSPAEGRSRTPTRNAAGLCMNNTTPLSSPQLKVVHSQTSVKEDSLLVSDKLTIEPIDNSKPYANSSIDLTDFVGNAPTPEGSGNVLRLIVPKTVYGGKSAPNSASSSSDSFLVLRQVRVRDAVNRLDMEIEEKLRERNLIGQIKALNSCDKIQIRARSVNFRWHRGIKIGQGRFGKVYTAVNNNTGELMAMKEIAIQPGETRALKNVAEELKILEGVNHKNLVRYYGIEVHREELLIFMELCSEGTLESLVELSGGLPEGLTRRFSAQLLAGVAELHKHGIVHRDIKTANIFLVDGSNSLKLGDFGSAVKIQAHTTVPGELQGYVGTQAYMAPEVFTKNNSDGHGRAADIWSVGCVVVEMASGSRPWAQFDSNFQIMFKVGMGEKPEIPDNLSQEGHDFLDHCLQHDPKLRMTAIELLEQNFCKYGRAEELSIEQLQERVRRSFRRNVKIT